MRPQPTFVIAEAGVNHNGDLRLAEQLVDVAVAAGVDAVKFQTFKAAKLVTRSASKADYQVSNTGDAGSQFDMLKALELSDAHHHHLKAYTEAKGIMFLSSPFDRDSMAFLSSLGMKIGKVPSGEITNLRYLQAMASSFEEIILSTGMSTLDEVREAVTVLGAGGLSLDNLTILHCNTEYPTPMGDVHLRAMDTLRAEFGCEVGYSDHTLGIEVPIAAVARGASMIEKHITLDRGMSGPDHASSLEPDELKAMTLAIRNIETALGTPEKRPSPSESKNRPIARKSLHARHDLPRGHQITEDDLIVIRPGDGLSPMRTEEILGRALTRALRAHDPILADDLEGVARS